MKGAAVVVTLILAVVCSACTGNKAAELFETARFEEVQNNGEHAQELYEEIMKKYPESEYAKKAQERVSVLKTKEKK